MAQEGLDVNLTESSKAPALIAQSNKQGVGTCLYQEWCKPLLISCEAAFGYEQVAKRIVNIRLTYDGRMDMKRAIITGATGAVGMALIQELIEKGVEVLVFCREGSKRNQRIPSHPLVNKLFCSLEQLETIKNNTGKKYDVFYHFAWMGTTGIERNDVYLQNKNVKYALDAVKAAKEFGCEVFVGAGSQAEYGRFEGNLNENTPTFPENGYGIAKLCAGQMTRILCNQEGIRHIWTRILSIYGPYDGEQSMIMSTIRQLLNGERPQLTKGEQKWDYLYSKDVGQAMRLLGDKGKGDRVYCLGSGKARPLHEYVEILKSEINKSATLGIGDIPYVPKQVMYLCADITALKEDTGFSPKYSFDDGIKETITWYKKSMN